MPTRKNPPSQTRKPAAHPDKERQALETGFARSDSGPAQPPGLGSTPPAAH